MPHRPRHISEPDNEVAFVRDCLRQLARDMQGRGEIPPDVSQAELHAEVEPRVPDLVDSVRRSPMYPHWKAAGHLEKPIRQLVRATLDAPASNPPAVARDQISYANTNTGQSISPTWKHRSRGGTVYMSEADHFSCNRCTKTGHLGAEIPGHLKPREQQMEYMLTNVEEVYLN